MKKLLIAVLLIILIFILIVGYILYYVLIEQDYDNLYSGSGGTLANPARGLSLQEAVEKFDESFVYYLLVNIKAYNLHSPLFSSDKPIIVLFVDEDIYNAEISDGKIDVKIGEVEKKDIIIRTTKEEAVKMIYDKTYIFNSFKNRGSIVEFVADKSTLALKGYLKLYEMLSSDNA